MSTPLRLQNKTDLNPLHIQMLELHIKALNKIFHESGIDDSDLTLDDFFKYEHYRPTVQADVVYLNVITYDRLIILSDCDYGDDGGPTTLTGYFSANEKDDESDWTLDALIQFFDGDVVSIDTQTEAYRPYSAS